MNQSIAVNWCDRWQLYQRLQELDIPCHCRSHQPLTVKIENPEAAFLVWSVTKRLQASRSELVQWLEECYRSKDK